MRRGRGCGKAARRLPCRPVADAWTLLTEDARERATFASLAATLALPATPAGPPNRLRDVVPALEKAFEIAQEGVPGPVFVEIAVDLLYDEKTVRE